MRGSALCGPECRRAVQDLLQEARELNLERPPDHRERIATAVASVQEYFRHGPEADLPANQSSPLLACVLALGQASEASPEGYAQAIDALATALDRDGDAGAEGSIPGST